MKTKFHIIQDYTSSDLEKAVQSYLDKGWKIVNTGYAKGLMVAWFAALVKETDAEEYMQ